MFSGSFPWWLSASLQRVREEVTTFKHLSQNREIAVCSSLSCPGHTDSVSVCAAENPQSPELCAPQQHSQLSLPGPGTSLPFVLLTVPATLGLLVHPSSSRLQSGDCLKSFPHHCQSIVPSAGGFCLPSRRAWRVPPTSVYLLVSSCRFTAPCFIP